MKNGNLGEINQANQPKKRSPKRCIQLFHPSDHSQSVFLCSILFFSLFGCFGLFRYFLLCLLLRFRRVFIYFMLCFRVALLLQRLLFLYVFFWVDMIDLFAPACRVFKLSWQAGALSSFQNASLRLPTIATCASGPTKGP